MVKDVLFVFDQPSAGARYRSEHLAEELGFLGISCDVVQSSGIALAAAVDRYDSFVLNRVEWTEDVAAFFERVRSRDKTVVFDTDDLIFEPELDRHFAFMEAWPAKDRRPEIERFDRFRRTLEACDRATVSTEPLAEYARKRVQHVEVVFNAVSKEMVRLSDEALESKRKRDDVTIAYLSGTRTHRRDFLEAADAVLWALETFPRARFLAVGKAELDQRFDRLGSRVTRLPLRPWQSLPHLLVDVDINLAPLERDNPVTESKSCVKYLEAGLVRVPTIASARTDFVRVIEPGVNGVLADTPDEWREAMRELIESDRLRAELGARAHENVRRDHTTAARAQELGVALDALRDRRAMSEA